LFVAILSSLVRHLAGDLSDLFEPLYGDLVSQAVRGLRKRVFVYRPRLEDSGGVNFSVTEEGRRERVEKSPGHRRRYIYIYIDIYISICVYFFLYI
jgi:hypothetical protein